MSTENNRLLLELDKTIREINRRVINPEIPELSLNDLNPIMELVARARSNYLNVPCRVIISPEKAILCSTPERS
jgi:hypothetical protein